MAPIRLRFAVQRSGARFREDQELELVCARGSAKVSGLYAHLPVRANGLSPSLW
jgi:hypothetical protein